jgi:hypothetical protein
LGERQTWYDAFLPVFQTTGLCLQENNGTADHDGDNVPGDCANHAWVNTGMKGQKRPPIVFEVDKLGHALLPDWDQNAKLPDLKHLVRSFTMHAYSEFTVF